MFQKGKKYRVKTWEELLATEGVSLYSGSLSHDDYSHTFEGMMMDHCGKVFEAPDTYRSVSMWRWGWDIWMVVEVNDTKRRLLNSIKDFV